MFDTDATRVKAFAGLGATGASTLEDFLASLDPPRIVWLMLPAAVVEATLQQLSPLLQAGDVVVDGGNSHYVDDIRRAKSLGARGIQYIDVGVSGGVRGLERGYCLMIGGDASVVGHLQPVFRTLAPGEAAAPLTPGRNSGVSTADEGYLYCGPTGAGHFVKMVHNAIEYALMASYAEGLNILALADVAEVWRRGSVIGSWLLDLTSEALAKEPDLQQFSSRVSDSGEGRWAAHAAIESSTPVPVLTAALFQRFSSRGEDYFPDRLQSAMRFQFGGHVIRRD